MDQYDVIGIAESNVSRSIEALIEAGLLSKTVEKGYDGRPIWRAESETSLREDRVWGLDLS